MRVTTTLDMSDEYNFVNVTVHNDVNITVHADVNTTVHIVVTKDSSKQSQVNVVYTKLDTASNTILPSTLIRSRRHWERERIVRQKRRRQWQGAVMCRLHHGQCDI